MANLMDRPLILLSRRASSRTEDRAGMSLLPNNALALGALRVTSTAITFYVSQMPN